MNLAELNQIRIKINIYEVAVTPFVHQRSLFNLNRCQPFEASCILECSVFSPFQLIFCKRVIFCILKKMFFVLLLIFFDAAWTLQI